MEYRTKLRIAGGCYMVLAVMLLLGLTTAVVDHLWRHCGP